MKDTFVRARISSEAVGRWKATARQRGRSLSALICGAVEAAIVGTVDQDSLDKHLRDIRAEANAAHLRVVARCRALIDAAPKVLWVGIEAIWNRGLREDRDAAPGARFHIDPDPPPEAPEGDPGPAWKIV